jgi:biopolymer transport protein ExbD
VTHSIVTANTNTGSITITLPAVANADNRTYTIIKTDAANTLTIDGDGAETINGSATQAYTDNYARITLICDGTEWFIIEETATP